MTDATGATGYAYDGLDRVEAVVYTATASSPITVAYGYDEAGHRTSLTYPDDDQVTYTYDKAGRMKTVEDWSDRFTLYDYDRAGRLLTTTLPNGVTSTYGYDGAGRLITITHQVTSTVLAQFVHVLDNVGNREARTGPGVDDVEDYTYDDTYRLKGVVYPNDDQTTYGYDAVGNRETMVEHTGAGIVTTTYNYDTVDRLTDLTRGGVPTELVWDHNGNQLGNGEDEYTYDSENRMVGAQVGPASSAYSYNGDGVRVGRVVTTTGITVTNFLLDVAANLPVVLDDGTHKYVYGVGLIAEVDDADDYLYYLPDAIGSTVGLTNDTGVQVQTYAYDVFGALRSQTGVEDNDVQFTGQFLDHNTELLFLRARYYDASIGRLSTRDPFGGHAAVPMSLAPYAYAWDNPVNATDPSGLSPWRDWWDDYARWLLLAGLIDQVTSTQCTCPGRAGVLGGQVTGALYGGFGLHFEFSVLLDREGNAGILFAEGGGAYADAQLASVTASVGPVLSTARSLPEMEEWFGGFGGSVRTPTLASTSTGVDVIV